jgi:glutathione synthase/RimK-type ligase-like ATP-grasp enzyme
MIELMNKGLPVTPTFKIENFSEERLDEILMLIKHEEFVIKPVVGASGVDTFKKKTKLSLEEKEQLITTFNERDVLIQPFIKSVVSEGEYSFMFFNRKYSHAVRKIAKTGEFRIQEEHGGRVEPYRSNVKELEQIENILNQIDHEFFYARVDVVKDDKGNFMLMEIELLEPQLFFTWGQSSASLFVDEFIKVFGR